MFKFGDKVTWRGEKAVISRAWQALPSGEGRFTIDLETETIDVVNESDLAPGWQGEGAADKDTRIAALEAERDAAIKEVGVWSRKAGLLEAQVAAMPPGTMWREVTWIHGRFCNVKDCSIWNNADRDQVAKLLGIITIPAEGKEKS